MDSLSLFGKTKKKKNKDRGDYFRLKDIVETWKTMQGVEFGLYPGVGEGL